MEDSVKMRSGRGRIGNPSAETHEGFARMCSSGSIGELSSRMTDKRTAKDRRPHAAYGISGFRRDAPVCNPPQDRTKVLAFVQENEREFLQGVDYGLGMAAKDRGLEYRRAVADNDAAKAVDQIEEFLSSKVGALVATSPDPAALSPILQKFIWSGAFVGTIVPPPATLLLNAPQYETGKVLTDAAISHIKAKLGGKATVVLLDTGYNGISGATL